MKGYEKVKELLESELSDYSYFKYGEIKLNKYYTQTDEDEYYIVSVSSIDSDINKTLSFHYNKNKDELEIELNEDSFEKVTTYDWRVKYFWMALLKW